MNNRKTQRLQMWIGVIALCAIASSAAMAQVHQPKMAWGTITTSTGGVPDPAGVTFTAYIETRAVETLIETSTGCSAETVGSDTQYIIECGNFGTQWQVDDVLIIEMNGPGGESKTENLILDGSGEQRLDIQLETDTAPTVTIVSPESKTYSSSTIPLDGTADEPIALWQYVLNGGPLTTFTPGVSSITAAEGSNTLTMYATDNVGNVGDADVTFDVDTTIPTVTIVSPESKTYSSSTILLDGTADEPIALWQYVLNGGPLTTFTPGVDSITATEGSNTLTMYATDNVGNVGNADVTFDVSAAAFKLAFTAQPEGPYQAGQEINAIPEVTVQNATGDTVTSSTAEITIAIGTNPAGGTLSGVVTRSAVNGVVSFPGLSIDNAGTGYTLYATSSGLTAAESDAFDITAYDFQLTITIEPPGAGTVTKDPDQPGYNNGQVVELTPVAGPAYIFTHWTGDVPEIAADAPAPEEPLPDMEKLLITMDSDKEITAMFNPKELVVYKQVAWIDDGPAAAGFDEVRVYDPDGVLCGSDVVGTDGEYYVEVCGDLFLTPEDEGAEPGDVLDFRIYDASEDKEYSGYEIFLDVITGEDPPEWTAHGDIWEVDIYALGVIQGLLMPNIQISTDNSREDRDQIKIQNAVIPVPPPADAFNPALDDVIVTVDGEEFEIPVPSFEQKGTKQVYEYKSERGVLPQVQMKLDFDRGLWSFKVSRATLTGIDNSDGVDICLGMGDSFHGENYVMEEKCQWRFNSRRNTASPVELLGTPMESLGIERASGKYDNTRDDRDQFKIQKAMLELPGGTVFDPLTDAVSLGIDTMSFDFPESSFEQKGSRPKYQYRSPRGDLPKLQMKLDFYSGAWSFSMSNGDCEQVTGSNSIIVHLIIGDCEDALKLNVDQKTRLKYRE